MPSFPLMHARFRTVPLPSNRLVSRIRIVSLVLALTSLAATGLDFRNWQAQAPGTIDVRESGVIRATYETPERKPVVIRPPQPVSLPEDARRVRFWYARTRGDAKLKALITDGTGSVHEVPLTTSHLAVAGAGHDASAKAWWPLWTKAETIVLEMPSEEEIRARMPADQRSETVKLLWPAPLTLTGLKLEPKDPDSVRWRGQYWKREYEEMGRGEGTFWFRNLHVYETDSFQADFYARLHGRLRWARGEPQFLFLDDMVPGEGRGRYEGPLDYAITVLDGYQGPVVWHHRGDGRLDYGNPLALFDQRVTLPKMPRGRYFIQTTAWNPDGTLAAERTFQWFVAQGPEHREPTVQLPLKWRTGHPHHVFPEDTRKARLILSVNPQRWQSVQGKAFCKVTIRNWKGEEVAETTLAAPGAHQILCPVQPSSDYFAVAELRDADSLYERLHLHFGVASPPEMPRQSRLPSSLPTLREIVENEARLHPEYRVGHVCSSTYPWISTLDMNDFKEWVDQTTELNAKYITFKARWPQIELLPGVYRWELLDEQVRYAGENGRQVIFGYTPISGLAEPIWADWLPMRDQNGNFPRQAGHASHWDAATRDARYEFWKTLAAHFKDNPSVAGYRTHSTEVDSDPQPKDGGPYRLDYSRPAQRAFKRWLRQQDETDGTMGRLLTVPGEHVSALPPDLSREWWHFVRFSTYTICEDNRNILAAIRSVDPQRVVIIDNKQDCYAIESLIPDLVRDGNAALKNEGEPWRAFLLLRSLSEQAGLPYLQELHRHMPTSRSIADATNFWGSYTAGGMFWLLKWTPKFANGEVRNRLHRDFPEVLDFLRRTQSHWHEFVQAEQPRPRVLVFGSRANGLVGGPRRGEHRNIAGRHTFHALFAARQIPVHLANEWSDWVDPADFDLVFACGKVMTRHAVERIARYAETGGKLVLVGSPGRYVPGEPDNVGVLAARLDGLPNVRHIEPPAKQDIEGVPPWHAPYAFDEAELAPVLKWAGVQRAVSVAANAEPGFECLRCDLADGRTVYVAVMRRWYGGYRGNIEIQEDLVNKYGRATGAVTVSDLADGPWRVERLHRTSRNLGIINASENRVRFELDPTVAGEVRLFRLTRQE